MASVAGVPFHTVHASSDSIAVHTMADRTKILLALRFLA
jgi:hypothetical protein